MLAHLGHEIQDLEHCGSRFILGTPGLQLNYITEVSNGSLFVVIHHVGCPPAEVDLGVFRIEADGMVVVSDGAVVIALAAVGEAPVVVGDALSVLCLFPEAQIMKVRLVVMRWLRCS